MPRPAVFLDRDGVVNEVVWRDGTAVAPLAPGELVIGAAVPAEIARLHEAGFETVVVTNQPDVARGLLDERVLDTVNDAVRAQSGVHHVYTCVHDGADDCPCRKPRPGMLLEAARDLELDLDRSWLVGDRWVDVAAGAAAGVRTILLANDYAWVATSAGAPPVDLVPTLTVTTLTDAVDAVLAASDGV